MIEIAIVVFIGFTGIAFALTGVLLLKFWASSLSHASRVGLSILFALLGPATLIAFAILADGDEDVMVSAAALAIVLIPIALIAWPAAHFATKKLDLLTEFEASTFE